MIIVHNGTCTMYCNFVSDIQIAKQAGYDGIEIISSKLYRYLDEGLMLETLLPMFEGLPPVAIGYIQDIERQAASEYEALLQEVERMCSVAERIGCPMVQLLTGPINPGIGLALPESYKNIVNLSWPELRRLTAKNLRVLSKIAKKHKVDFYLEALSWAPLGTLGQMLELLDETGCDNMGILIDFWHLSTSGATPEDVAKLDKRLIKGVQVCDSEKGDGSSHLDRHIWTGGGVIPLKHWAEAIKATGFDGWWTAELFSPRHWEMDPFRVARSLREFMVHLLA